MQDIMTDTLVILITCLVIAAFATALVMFRPAARRRRRHKRHSRRPKIDLFEPVKAGPAPEPDA